MSSGTGLCFLCNHQSEPGNSCTLEETKEFSEIVLKILNLYYQTDDITNLESISYCNHCQMMIKRCRDMSNRLEIYDSAFLHQKMLIILALKETCNEIQHKFESQSQVVQNRFINGIEDYKKNPSHIFILKIMEAMKDYTMSSILEQIKIIKDLDYQNSSGEIGGSNTHHDVAECADNSRFNRPSEELQGSSTPYFQYWNQQQQQYDERSATAPANYHDQHSFNYENSIWPLGAESAGCDSHSHHPNFSYENSTLQEPAASSSEIAASNILDNNSGFASEFQPQQWSTNNRMEYDGQSNFPRQDATNVESRENLENISVHVGQPQENVNILSILLAPPEEQQELTNSLSSLHESEMSIQAPTGLRIKFVCKICNAEFGDYAKLAEHERLNGYLLEHFFMLDDNKDP